MEEIDLKYNAFISYRHNDLDKYVAENLHRLIETYKMPEAVVKKYNLTDNNFRRVFRDQEELPLASNLEDSILEALKKSDFLIVICSPRLKESIWCQKEIENFIKFHGREKVLCVLIEGEPDESFPEILRYNTIETTTKTGKKRHKKVECEPLAMDIRGSNKSEIFKNMKRELIRVIAPMYNLNYDDIKRRHEERELKRKANIFKIIAIASFIFALYSIFLFSKIYISSNKIKYNQSIMLADEASNLLNKDNRLGSVEKAYQSVTKYDNTKMPVTAKGILELTNSLGVYYPNNYNYHAVSQLDTFGIVKYMKTDKDGKYLLTYDDSEEINLWNLETEKKIKTIYINYSGDKKFAFIGNKGFAYIDDRGDNLTILDLKGNEITKIKYKTIINSVNASSNGKYLVVKDNSNIYVYETEKFTELSSYRVSDDLEITEYQYFSENEENIVFATKIKEATLDLNSLRLYTYNINTKQIISNISIDSHYLQKVIFKDDTAIVLSNKIKGDTAAGIDMIVTSYNYKNGRINYKNVYSGCSGVDIEMTFSSNGYGTLLVASGEEAKLLDLNYGHEKSRLTRTFGSAFIHDVNGSYRLFTTDGKVIWIKNSDDLYSMKPDLSSYLGLHLNNYKQFLYTSSGYLGYASNDNRIIIYSQLKNKDIKEIEYEEVDYEAKENNYIYFDYDKKPIIEEYNFKNKDLIYYMFYSDSKEFLFVTYKNNILEIYNNKTKKLLKTIKGIDKNTSSFVTKTKDGYYIIKHSTFGGYILNKNFEVVAFVSDLVGYKDDKLILEDSNKYFAVKKYSEKEIINKGKDFLKSKGKIS